MKYKLFKFSVIHECEQRREKKNKMIYKLLFVFWFAKQLAAQSNCDYYERITGPKTRVQVTNPGYPDNYSGAQQCRWIIDCPSGYNCRLDCPEINIPQSTSCMLDRILVSKTGDPQLAGADSYCGRGSLSVVSSRQRLSVGLIAPSSTRGGKFRCEITAQPVTSDSNCRCGSRMQNRIVGGEETGINEYPMMVGIVDARISQIKCGGVIISDYYVLTAAHCLTNLVMERTAIIVGEHNITKNDSPATKAYRVDRFTKHPQYSANTQDYDIAIIRVAEPIQFNERVGPVCLPFKYVNEDFYKKKVTVLGWGTVFFGGPDSKVLLKADLDVISQGKCAYREPSITNRQICTYTPGKDACQDDSGGPLLYTDPTTAVLFSVGIVSNGRSCASEGNPGVNTRVTAFLDWILATTQVSYCVK